MTKVFEYIVGFIIVVFFSACAQEENRNSSVPFARVEIDIQTQIENEFNNPFYSKKYANWGYAGVIAISNAEASWIYAYDMCCPREVPLKNEVEVLSNRLHAQCPKCKTVYNIADGTGKVISGPGSERLKTYRVIREGYLFRIRN